MDKLLNKCFMMIQGIKDLSSFNIFLSEITPFMHRVLYFSIHGYQNGAFWPHLRESDYHNIGRGAGLGTTRIRCHNVQYVMYNYM
jgi:hypothetical protein